MAARDPLFVVGPAGAGQTSPTEARLALGGLAAPGAGGVDVRAGIFHGPGNPLTVSGTSATGTMTYSVAAGAAVASRGAAIGPYLGVNDSTATVPTTAAPGSGSRYDLVWIRFPDAEQGDADSTATLGVTQGTASGSPSKPYASVPAGALVLAECLMPSGTTRTDTGVTITQVAPYAAARGGFVPARSQTERAAMTGYDGLLVWRIDRHRPEALCGTEWLEVLTGLPPLPWVAASGAGQTITATSWASLPTPLTLAVTNPSSTRDLLVEVKYGANMGATASDVRACVTATGGLTIGAGVGAGGAAGWGDILWAGAISPAVTTAPGTTQHGSFPAVLPAGTTTTFEMKAYRTAASGAQVVNYPVMRVWPHRYV